MEYVTIKLPKNIITEIDAFMEKTQSYTSRTDLIKNAVRDYFFKYDNGNKNYQPPESGEERTIQGGNKNEQMDTTERPDTRMDTVRLSADQREQESTDESRVEDPTKKVESRDGEDDPTS